MILDVGCGNNPHGDVNCDLYVVDTEGHRSFEGATKLNYHAIPNFVKCDGQYLPFQNSVFSEVFSSQVIEHMADPVRFLRELTRVSSSLVTVECPHYIGEALSRFGKSWRKKHHIQRFNRQWFEKAAHAVGLNVIHGSVLNTIGVPHPYLALIQVPFNIRMEMVKNGR